MSDKMPFVTETPFVVEEHETMFMRVAAGAHWARPNTVLTIEAMIYSWRICENTDPFFIGRAWSYEAHEFGIAVSELLTYLEVEAATEPQGWLRADDIDEWGRSRTRRAHVEFGERVITVDGEEA